MNPSTDPHTDVYLEAAQWLDRLSDGKLDKLSQKRFSNWLNAQSKHREVFESMLKTWQAPELSAALKQVRQTHIWQERRSQWNSPLRIAGGLAIGLWLLVMVYRYTPEDAPEIPYEVHFATRIAEQQDKRLDDGSTLEMDADCELSVSFSAVRRMIKLDKGATYFDVASDKSRPFEVTLGKASVVAVGTEFNIDRSQSGSDVTVYEGAIEVRPWPGSHPTLLRAGERIRIDNKGLSPIESVELGQLVDWRSGWIEIKDQPLSYLIERLNRQSTKVISTSNAQIANLRVAGRFRLKDTSQTLAMLGEIYNLSVREENNQLIVADSIQ